MKLAETALVHVRSFSSAEGLHGGVLRSNQLEYLAKRYVDDHQIWNFKELAPQLDEASDVPELLRGVRWQRGLHRPRGARWRARTGAILRRALEVGRAVAFEPPALATKVPAVQAQRCVALAHNLEALTPRSSGYLLKEQLQHLRYELLSLAEFRAVYCISREDQWFLTTLGIDARYLPFYPDPHRVAELEALRSTRSRLVENRLLVLGSMTNPPSQRALHQTIVALHGHGLCRTHMVTLAGGGLTPAVATDLRSHCAELDIRGRVTTAVLHGLIQTAAAAIVFQTPTSGWPTRLVEMPLAGLPVVVNQASIRAQETPPPGVTLTTLEGLGAAIYAARAGMPAARPAEEAEYGETLLALSRL